MCEKEMVNTTRVKMSGLLGYSLDDPFRNSHTGNPFMSFSNGYCKVSKKKLSKHLVEKLKYFILFILKFIMFLGHCQPSRCRKSGFTVTVDSFGPF